MTTRDAIAPPNELSARGAAQSVRMLRSNSSSIAPAARVARCCAWLVDAGSAIDAADGSGTSALTRALGHRRSTAATAALLQRGANSMSVPADLKSRIADFSTAVAARFAELSVRQNPELSDANSLPESVAALRDGAAGLSISLEKLSIGGGANAGAHGDRVTYGTVVTDAVAAVLSAARMSEHDMTAAGSAGNIAAALAASCAPALKLTVVDAAGEPLEPSARTPAPLVRRAGYAFFGRTWHVQTSLADLGGGIGPGRGSGVQALVELQLPRGAIADALAKVGCPPRRVLGGRTTGRINLPVSHRRFQRKCRTDDFRGSAPSGLPGHVQNNFRGKAPRRLSCCTGAPVSNDNSEQLSHKYVLG